MSLYRSDAFDCLPSISKEAQISLVAVVLMQIQYSIQWKPKDWHIYRMCIISAETIAIC